MDTAARRQVQGRGSPRPSRPAAEPARWDELSFPPEDDPLPLELLDELEGKEVDLVVMDATIRPTFSGEKSLVLSCRVLVDGEPKMVPTSRGPIALDLPCYYRLPVRSDGKPYVPSRSKFYRTWCRLNQNQRPSRRDRMRLSLFRERLLHGRVRTVKTGSTQPHKELDREFWRLVIDDVTP